MPEAGSPQPTSPRREGNKNKEQPPSKFWPHERCISPHQTRFDNASFVPQSKGEAIDGAGRPIEEPRLAAAAFARTAVVGSANHKCSPALSGARRIGFFPGRPGQPDSPPLLLLHAVTVSHPNCGEAAIYCFCFWCLTIPRNRSSSACTAACTAAAPWPQFLSGQRSASSRPPSKLEAGLQLAVGLT
jgi:hypothetical protein